MQRPAAATALEYSTVIRVARTLFPRVLESDPAAARRLRDELATRTSQIASDILMAGATSTSHARRVRRTLYLQRHRHRHMVGRPLPAAGVAGDRKSLTPSCSARETQM